MSAFIVSHAHIQYLVAALAHYDLLQGTPQEIGQMLWDANIRSVWERYPGDMDDLPAPGGPYDYLPDTPRLALVPAQVAKAALCYQYQTCETEDAEQTQGWLTAQALLEAVAPLPQDPRRLPGYQDAAWEIRDLTPFLVET